MTGKFVAFGADAADAESGPVAILGERVVDFLVELGDDERRALAGIFADGLLDQLDLAVELALLIDRFAAEEVEVLAEQRVFLDAGDGIQAGDDRFVAQVLLDGLDLLENERGVVGVLLEQLQVLDGFLRRLVKLVKILEQRFGVFLAGLEFLFQA